MKDKYRQRKAISGISIRKIMSTIFIIAGLIIITVPIIGKIITNKDQQEMMNQFYLEIENGKENQIDIENTQLDEALQWGAEITNQDEIDSNNEAVNGHKQDDIIIKKMPKTIGIIKINKINVRLPIAEGVELDVLNFAVGHMTGTAELGEAGNSVLAGHRSHTFGTFFNRLDEVEVGDNIEIIKSDGTSITYEVNEKLFVKPDDLSVLGSNPEYKVLTLITCHPEINPTERLVIHAVAK